MKNLRTALERNPKLKGRLRLNLFSGRIDVDGELPWVRPGIAKTWNDDDAAQLRIYLEPFFGKIAKTTSWTLLRPAPATRHTTQSGTT